MILQLPIRRTSLPPSPYLSSFTLANWNPLQQKPRHVLHRFQYFLYSIRPQATTSIWYTKSYIKPRQSNLLSSLYTDRDTLWVKHAAHQKVESLRTASPSIQSTLNSLQNGRWSFIFTTHLMDTTNAAIFTKKQFFFFIQVSLPYFTLTCSQNHSDNPH